MNDVRAPKAMTRRELLRGGACLAGAVVLTPMVPAWARAAKPTADLDASWGKGFMAPDVFVSLVYNLVR